MKRSLTVLAAAALLVGLMVSPVVAAETTGTWVQYPNGATSFFAEVQQPINSANTSNWSAKSKGGIPIMYKLFEQQGPAVFESIYSDNAVPTNDFAYASFTPDSLTFNQITTLKTDYAFTLGDCHKGALRWQARTSATQAVFIYYGELPNFTDCTTNSQSGVNMVGFSDLRYDTSQYTGGTFYDTYAHAQSLMGNLPLLRVSLVIDGGWGGDQRLTVSNITVNDNVYQWVAGGSDALEPTCDLPDAFIDITKVNPAPTGTVNESTVYPQSATDDTDQFRIVDCKDQYIQSIPDLNGTGSYDVEIIIDGSPVATSDLTNPASEVRFDIK